MARAVSYSWVFLEDFLLSQFYKDIEALELIVHNGGPA